VAAPVAQPASRPSSSALSGGTPLEPLSRRLLQVAGFLSLLLILVFVNSLLNSGSASPFSPNPVAAAAQRTQEVPGMRMSMTLRVNGSAGAMTINGDGSYNGETNLTEILYRATTPKGPVQFDAVLGDAWYFRYPQFADQMPEGKEWIKLEGLAGQQEINEMGVESPHEMLETVGAAGTVQRAGHATVRKEQTTRYRLTLSPEEIVEVLRAQGKTEIAEQLENGSVQLLGPVRAEAFIDRHGVLRRVRTLATVSTEGQTVTSDARMDFFDFGVEPDIQVPDDSQVYDLSPVLEEKLDGLGQLS
jgi:hypothetical protein